jgi:cell division ATPase FtsA
MFVVNFNENVYLALPPSIPFTNDLARMLSTPVAHAERLKTLYGNAQSCPDDEREMLPVPLVGEEEHQIAKVPRSMVVNIIRPRLEETFEMVKERLDGSGLTRAAGTRVVLTGGACQLGGARELAGRHHRVLAPVAALLQQDHVQPGLGQFRGHGRPARPRPDDHHPAVQAQGARHVRLRDQPADHGVPCSGGPCSGVPCSGVPCSGAAVTAASPARMSGP